MTAGSSKENTRQAEDDTPLRGVKVDLRKALLGGAIAAGIAIAGIWLVGRLSGAEARVLTETLSH